LRLEGGDTDAVIPELCHYVGHANAVKSSLSVEENLAFWADFLGQRSDDLEAALAAFGLSPLADLPAGLLSAGQKRRLGLARLLAATRPIWLLDEPQTSLDAASVELLDAALRNHLGGGRHRYRQVSGAADTLAKQLALGKARFVASLALLARRGFAFREAAPSARARLLSRRDRDCADRARTRFQSARTHGARHVVGGASPCGAAVG
jgi:hypothetical protein